MPFPSLLRAAILFTFFLCLANGIAQSPWPTQPSMNPTSAYSLTVPAFFSDHMVLQQGNRTAVWGTGAPSETVTVAFGKAQASATVDQEGKWKVVLPEMKAGQTGELRISGSESKNRPTFTDVIVGEVWVCSGQSNMEWPLKESLNGPAEVAAAGNPNLRLFQIPSTPEMTPQTDVSATWRPCTPESVAGFSAVAYYFGKKLSTELNVPVGLIQSAVGGTPAEAWTPAHTLESDSQFAELLAARKAALDSKSVEDIRKLSNEIEAAWKTKVDALLNNGAQPDPSWFSATASSQGWRAIRVPGAVDSQLGLQTDGSFWVKITFEVPAESAGQPGTLHLGPVDDFDFTWLNGKLVGKTGRETTDAWRTSRTYAIPEDLLKAGTNVLVIRLIDEFNEGGLFWGASHYYVELASGRKTPLAGLALARLETDLGAKPAIPIPDFPGIAGTLYDGMIAPLTSFAIQGAIWYQGESNVGRANQYQSLFPQLIQTWRNAWGRELPFYFVQLAAYESVCSEPVESAWAELREAQAEALALPATGMAVATDIGEERDIHPRNKKAVGDRLASLALAGTYGKSVPAHGPAFASFVEESGKLQIAFLPATGGLVARPIPDHYTVSQNDGLTAPLVRNSPGSELEGFAIRGKEGPWVWADAKIEGETVVVWSAKVPNPVAVRYNWANFPFGNLYNRAGWPAPPFRTDGEAGTGSH